MRRPWLFLLLSAGVWANSAIFQAAANISQCSTLTLKTVGLQDAHLGVWAYNANGTIRQVESVDLAPQTSNPTWIVDLPAGAVFSLETIDVSRNVKWSTPMVVLLSDQAQCLGQNPGVNQTNYNPLFVDTGMVAFAQQAVLASSQTTSQQPEKTTSIQTQKQTTFGTTSPVKTDSPNDGYAPFHCRCMAMLTLPKSKQTATSPFRLAPASALSSSTSKPETRQKSTNPIGLILGICASVIVAVLLVIYFCWSRRRGRSNAAGLRGWNWHAQDGARFRVSRTGVDHQ
jgi:hypothetical protein